MQPRRHLLVTCSVLLIAALLVACGAPAAAPAPPVDTPVPPADTPVPPTAASDPLAVVQAWVEAINSGDMDAALDIFAEDSRYRMHYTANNKDELRWVFTWLTGLETEFEILDCQPQDNRADCSLTVTDGCIAISASPTLPVKCTFTVQDGKIKEAAGSGTGPEWSAYWNFVPVVQSWERVFRPEDYAFLSKNEGTYEAAKVAIKLCRDYETVVKTQEPATAAAAQGLVDAINSGDVDAALALLPNEAKFQMLNDKAAGAEELRSMFDWLAGKETQYQISDCEWQGIAIQCAVSVTDGCIAASGATDGLHGTMVFFSEEDGTLRQVNIAPKAVERKAYETWLEAETAWASANRGDELAQAEGYSQEAGATAVKLCQEYAAAQAPAQDPVSVVRAWLDALNAGDLEAAMALMTLDAVIPGWGTAPARNVLDWWIDIKSHYGAPDCQETGDRLVCIYIMTDDGCITASGNTAGLPLRYTFDMQDGKIRSVHGGEVGNDDWSRYGKWSEGMEAWAKASRAEEWAKIDLTTFGEGGEIIIKLCQEYAETLK